MNAGESGASGGMVFRGAPAQDHAPDSHDTAGGPGGPAGPEAAVAAGGHGAAGPGAAIAAAAAPAYNDPRQWVRFYHRRGGRAAEGAAFEMRSAGNRRGGSNPSLSVININPQEAAQAAGEACSGNSPVAGGAPALLR